MIIQIGTKADESKILWKHKESDKWKKADIDDLIKVYEYRPKGEWLITDTYPHNVYCSECYTTFAQAHWGVWEDGSLPRNFCPNCGADMRGNKE